MSPYRTINVSKLNPGDTLGEAVFSEGLTKLLGSGCAVSEQLIKRLAERGVTEVVVQIPIERAEKQQRSARLPVFNVRPQSIVDASRLVEHPCQCGNIVAIQTLSADLPAAAWICKTCGTAYFGGVSSTKNHGVELLAANQASSLAGDDQPESIGQAIPAKTDVAHSCSVGDKLTGRERRQQIRYSIGVPVVAVPLLANFTIVGPAVRMMTRDISQSGIALAHARFSDAPYYVVDFTSAGIELLQALVKVLRVSNSGPTYEVAGTFSPRLHCSGWHANCC
jgi:hypothetical protein